MGEVGEEYLITIARGKESRSTSPLGGQVFVPRWLAPDTAGLPVIS